MIHKLEAINLYTAAVCNLNCVYCYIDKSPALQKIDAILEKSFASDYYFDYSKELFEPEDLKMIHFWGGEPSMGLHRMYNLLPKFIEYYPNLYGFMMSTNFTIPNWFEEFYGFLKVLGNYPYREFEFALQLSIDGPEYINDMNRGKGTTKLFLEHYNEFIQTINLNVPNNVRIKAHFKPTYSAETIAMLQDKQKIIDYFTFFDNLITQFNSTINNEKVVIVTSIPNTAVPAAHTQQDGINFANYCRLTREIEKEHRFKNYNIITTYAPRHHYSPCKDTSHFDVGCYHCGAGIRNIGLLPDRHLSLCHSGFASLLEEYKINSMKNHMDLDDNESVVLKALYTNNSKVMDICIPFEDYPKIKKILEAFYAKGQTFQMVNTVSLIQSLALAGQIEKRFCSKEEAHKAAHFILSNTATCMRDNANVTGSISMTPIGFPKLLLNGAYEYLIGEVEV